VGVGHVVRRRRRPTIQFGCRGLLYVNLKVRMLDFDQHSGWASIYPSAAHYLVAALASLRDVNMNIKIDGFYDRVVKPTDADRQDDGEDRPGRSRSAAASSASRSSFATPSRSRSSSRCSSCPRATSPGVTDGIPGPWLEDRASGGGDGQARLSAHPRPGPSEVLELLRKHLDRNGFEKVEIGDWRARSRRDPTRARPSAGR